jgi:hypothetical protein
MEVETETDLNVQVAEKVMGWRNAASDGIGWWVQSGPGADAEDV